MHYFYKQMPEWFDTTYTELAPEIMERKGWIRCSKKKYDSCRAKNAAANRKQSR